MAESFDEPSEEEEEENDNPLPDRPLECTECRRPIAVKYTEIVGDQITHTSMCSECPVLKRRLYGAPHVEVSGQPEIGAGLACGNCGTTLDSIRVGALLGCEVCFEVFDDILVPEIVSAGKISSRVAANKKNIPLHMGRTPGKVQEINPSLRLLALNEALNEMLKSEDYEQAAWLRDQIKALTDRTEKEKEKDEKQ